MCVFEVASEPLVEQGRPALSTRPFRDLFNLEFVHLQDLVRDEINRAAPGIAYDELLANAESVRAEVLERIDRRCLLNFRATNGLAMCNTNNLRKLMGAHLQAR